MAVECASSERGNHFEASFPWSGETGLLDGPDGGKGLERPGDGSRPLARAALLPEADLDLLLLRFAAHPLTDGAAMFPPPA